MTIANQPFLVPIRPDGLCDDFRKGGFQDIDQYEPPSPKFGQIRSLSRSTFTAFIPEPSEANGTGIIIYPGGGFRANAFDQEGTETARWFQERGVAAFILSYGLTVDYEAHLWSALIDMANPRSSIARIAEMTHQAATLAVEDGKQALRTVRQRAAEWQIRPDKIGMVGFSAGARVTVGVATEYEADSRPDFAASIYGAHWKDTTVPPDAPPLFVLAASDDEWALTPSLTLYSAWRKAGHSVELHMYSSGGHGFGMKKQGLPVDNWIDRFNDWLHTQGLIS